MKIFTLETYHKHSTIIALVAIIISITAWATEFAGIVYVCPYCRVQRTIIGLLGLILILPFSYHWIARFMAMVLGAFGVIVASNQHFMGWKKISAGTFQFNENIFIDPFLLSGLALTAIIALTYLILYVDKRS